MNLCSPKALAAKALVEKRPNLADKVQAGEITLNEALRRMKKETAEEKRAKPEAGPRPAQRMLPNRWGCRSSRERKNHHTLRKTHRRTNRGRSPPPPRRTTGRRPGRPRRRSSHTAQACRYT